MELLAIQKCTLSRPSVILKVWDAIIQVLNIKAVKSLIARQWIWRLLLKLTTIHLLTAILLLTIIRASYSHFIIVLTTSILTDSGHTRKEAATSGIIHTIYLLVITYSLYIIWTISDMTASFLFLFALLYFYWLNSFTI